MYSRVALCSNRYEDEINKRAGAENEFVLLKKVRKHQDAPLEFKTEQQDIHGLQL